MRRLRGPVRRVGSGWAPVAAMVVVVMGLGVAPATAAQTEANTPTVLQAEALPPLPPKDVVAAAGDGSATVKWAAPQTTDEERIISYTVTALPSDRKVQVEASRAHVDGLTNGTSYTFVVRADNVAGTSEPSAPSNPVKPAAGLLKEHTVPGDGASALAVGRDGVVWFGMQGGLGRLASDGEVTQFATSTSDGPSAISVGGDGRVWFLLPSLGKVGTIGPKGKLAEFAIPGGGEGLVSIAASDDGAWFTRGEASLVGHVDTKGRITEFPTMALVAGPAAIAVATDGNAWFVEARARRFGRLTPDGLMREFDLPPGGSVGPIAAATDGSLWFVGARPGLIGRITQDGKVTTYALPKSEFRPSAIAATGDGRLYLAQEGSRRLGWFDPASGRFGEAEVPGPEDAPLGPFAYQPAGSGSDSAQLWFTGTGEGRIGSIPEWAIKPKTTVVLRAAGVTAPTGSRSTSWLLLGVGATVVIVAAMGSGLIRRRPGRFPVRPSRPRVPWLAVCGGVALLGFPSAAMATWPDTATVSLPRTVGLTDDRIAHSATLLDPPACHREKPPGDYPCGQVLAVGGSSIQSHSENYLLASVERFDPEARRWRMVAPMSRVSAGHSATLLPDGKVLVVGGQTLGVVEERRDRLVGSKVAQIYDPARDRWTTLKGMLKESRYYHSATLLDGPACRSPRKPAYCGDVLVVGGADSMDARGTVGSAEIFDARTSRWRATAPLPSGRESHSATLLPDGRVLVAGGLDSSGTPLNTAEVYDPATGSWAETGAMGGGRAFHTATLLDGPACRAGAPAPYCGQVMAAGGFLSGQVEEYWQEGISTSSVEVYDPEALVDGVRGAWRPTGSLVKAHEGHTAVLMPGGDVVVTGGNPEGSVERYDPSKGRWREDGALMTTRFNHTATLLDGPGCRDEKRQVPLGSCGTLLVVGGSPGGGETIGAAVATVAPTELYRSGPVVRVIRPDHGGVAGGTAVEIAGDGFVGRFQIRFADKAVECPSPRCRVITPTALTLTTPPHDAGPVPVVATRATDGGPPLPDPPVLFTYER